MLPVGCKDGLFRSTCIPAQRATGQRPGAVVPCVAINRHAALLNGTIIHNCCWLDCIRCYKLFYCSPCRKQRSLHCGATPRQMPHATICASRAASCSYNCSLFLQPAYAAFAHLCTQQAGPAAYDITRTCILSPHQLHQRRSYSPMHALSMGSHPSGRTVRTPGLMTHPPIRFLRCYLPL